MKIQLSEHFTYSKLARFVLPSVGMMIFVSIYGVVDGLFVSNFVGKTPFAALNLIVPALMIFGPLGSVAGTGGSALVAKTMGEGDYPRANRYFSLLVYAMIIAGIILTVAGILLMRPIAHLLGAEGELLDYATLYGQVSMISMPAFMLQNMFQSFMVTAEKPRMGFWVTVISGVLNMVLDALFIVVFGWGLVGAALATAAGEFAGGVIPLVYFARKNKSPLKIGHTKLEWRILGKTCTNGASEFVSTIAFSLISMLFNFQLLRLAGENGVAAYGVMMYVSFIFAGIFFGYALGTGPIISFHFGAENIDELQNLFRKSIRLMVITGIALTIISLLLAQPLAKLFVGYDETLYQMTKAGLMLYSLGFTVTGVNIFGSFLFTDLNNGLISATISFVRSFVFKTSTVLILPIFMGLNGVWLSMLASEILSLLLTLFFIVRKRSTYHYY